MESLQHIKRRLRSVRNIGQITKAMELVAATKMRRSQEVALASRPYAFAALEILANLSRTELGDVTSPLLEQRPTERTAIVLVASDKGLTGAFNSSVFRVYEKASAALRAPRYIAVGQKAVLYLQRKGEDVEQAFTQFGDFTTVREVVPLAQYIMEGYRERRWDKVIFFYTNFTSALSQTVVMREVLPVSFVKIQETTREIIPATGRFAAAPFGGEPRPAPAGREYLIEPSREETFASLIPHLVTMQIYHIVLEANASEHASRRLAMKNASDNASELSDELTLAYNKARQAGITRELIEITAGAEALS